jgi:DNA repair exonuclease SbcCD ATPase subunit
MRRLLADVDDRADAKVREMRERMEAAIEERDRAEDEASTNGRRRAREVDELKGRIRDFERDLKRATDEKEELERSEKEWKRKRDELESISESASKEVADIRSAMTELRDALDSSEKQVRDAEKHRADLRRILDEANQRYEKVSKEFKALQAKQKDVSSRSSFDSGSGRGTPINGVGPGIGKVDYTYLKTILLQFVELRDKKRQADLVRTVLGQLLHFDKFVPPLLSYVPSILGHWDPIVLLEAKASWKCISELFADFKI